MGSENENSFAVLADGDDEQKAIDQLWEAAKRERDDETGELQWYKRAKDYWENTPATVNGVLGGYSYVSVMDVKGSQAFLAPLLRGHPKPWTALGTDLTVSSFIIVPLLMYPMCFCSFLDDGLTVCLRCRSN